MIILVGGIKGGTGKSTIATNLTVMRANANKSVLLVDADSQKSATDFSRMRSVTKKDNTGYICIQLQNRDVRTEVQKMKNNYDDIFIDTGGRDSNSQRAGLVIADIMLIPFSPRSFDIWTLEPLKKLLEEIQTVNSEIKIYAFINRADPKGSDNQEAEMVLQEEESITYIDTPIGNRKAFANGTAQGLAATEMNPKDKKANNEITKLYQSIFNV